MSVTPHCGNLLSVPVGEAHRLRDGVWSFGIQSLKVFVAVVVVHLLCSNSGLCFEVVSKMPTNQFKNHGGKRTKSIRLLSSVSVVFKRFDDRYNLDLDYCINTREQ